MADAPTSLDPPARRTHGRSLLLTAFAAFAGAAGALAGAAFFLRPQADAAQTTVRGTSSVVSAVRQLARLETVRFHMERVIDIRDRQSHFFGLVESEDAMLLVAAVDVTAGVDLARLKDGDVQVDELRRRVRLELPAPEILGAQLDNAHTYVHSRSTDRLAVPARTLETRARQEAEHSLRDAALASGILERAGENAAQTLRTLLTSLAFEEVEISFQTE